MPHLRTMTGQSALKPDYAEAYYNRGNVLRELKRLETRSRTMSRAIALKPDFAEAYDNRGNALFEIRSPRGTRWRATTRRSLSSQTTRSIQQSRERTFRTKKSSRSALASYDKAIALRPDYAEAYYGRGNALRELRSLEDALANYEKAIGFKPDYDFLFGSDCYLQRCSFAILII